MTACVRCGWLPLDKADYVAYHDHEWAVPVHDDQRLFEMLCLEGAEAGLSWYMILRRRAGYRAAFCQFDPAACAALTDENLADILATGDIIRNRLKVKSVRQNARAFLAIQQEYGSFDAYLWGFVSGIPQINRPATLADVAAQSPLSDALSKDLKKRGFSFVGSSIVYAYLQAVGVVNDHTQTCFLCPPAP